VRKFSEIRGIGQRSLTALAAFTIVLAGCLALAGAAQAEGPYVYQGGVLDLDLSDYGDFNAIPHADDEDPSFLFNQNYGMEGDAGLAIYLPSLGQVIGLAGDNGFYTSSQSPDVQETAQGRLITSHIWVDDPNDLGEPPTLALLEITQTFLLSNDNQTLSVSYSIKNVSGGQLRFRPYLLGSPYLLNLSQFGLETNSIKSVFSIAPAPTLSMSSTNANRTLSVVSTGTAQADSAQVFGFDSATSNPGLERIYTGVLSGGSRFATTFDRSELTDPAFGMEWKDWMTPTGLANDQTARVGATFAFANPGQAGNGTGASGIPLSGRVLIKVPGGGFTELHPGDRIPNRSLIDTTRGTLQISVRGSNGSPQTAAFKDGVFRLLRTSSSPVTTLKLEGPLACGARSASSSATGTRTSTRGGKGRSLWGSGKGKFRTSGKRGSGSVRGTTWQVTDRCDGSTKIESLKGASQGIVDAKDFGKPGKKIMLKPGQSYIAKPGK